MPLPSIKNSVGMAVTSVASAGVGTITLGAALSGGYQTASTAYAANANIDIRIEEGDTWEVCRDCTYTHSGTTVTRGTLEDGSSGTSTRVAFTSAAKVYVVETANRVMEGTKNGVVHITNDGSTTQSIAFATSTKVAAALATEVVDENGWWDHANKKFIPTRPGWYLCGGSFGFDSFAGAGDTSEVLIDFYLNGSVHKRVVRLLATNGYPQPSGWALIYMNGSTDYVELYVTQVSGSAKANYASGGDALTWFSAKWESY